MIIFRAYKFRLYPTYEQKVLIYQTFASIRFVYNYFLLKKEEYYKETKGNITLSNHELVF